MAKETIIVDWSGKKPIPTSRVPKYTEVKEGQQYPTGRGGQLKAFHEHVWPKGYTPERRREVGDLKLPITGGSSSYKEGGETKRMKTHKGVAKAHVEETLARSTVPLSDMQRLKENKTKFSVRELGGNTQTSSKFYYTNPHVRINVNTKDTAADVSTQVIHEVGHAVDYAKDKNVMLERLNEMTSPYADYGPLGSKSTKGSHPVVEGIAEGYAAAHTRLTRGQKRTGGDVSNYGYNMFSWKYPRLGKQFEETRAITYKQETGKYWYEAPDYDDDDEPSQGTQLRLFK
jgi:hypothetical protein